MKIDGREIKGPNVEIVVIPRPDGDIVLKAETILNFNEFNKYCPVPKPPVIFKRGAGRIDDLEDKTYKVRMREYGEKRMDWIVITSLRPSLIEWEKVKLAEPETWKFYKEELESAGFGEFEIGRIIRATMIANSLDESKLEEARNRFLAGQEEDQKALSSPNSEQKNTQSGELANASV